MIGSSPMAALQNAPRRRVPKSVTAGVIAGGAMALFCTAIVWGLS